jgi:hypothetical protein
MRECIEAQERAFAGVLTGASVSRPRLDMFVPCDREDGYYRSGSVEGASDGVAVRLKSDVMIWPEAPDGTRSECNSPRSARWSTERPRRKASAACSRPNGFCRTSRTRA